MFVNSGNRTLSKLKICGNQLFRECGTAAIAGLLSLRTSSLTELDVAKCYLCGKIPPQSQKSSHPGSWLPDYEGVVALAAAIRKNRTLRIFTFGDKQPVTMDSSKTSANFSGKQLLLSGIHLLAAFLPKCT